MVPIHGRKGLLPVGVDLKGRHLARCIFFGIAFLLLSVFVLLSTYWHWWGTISGWLVQQTAAALGLWLVPLLALASYALLRKATVWQANKSIGHFGAQSLVSLLTNIIAICYICYSKLLTVLLLIAI